MQYGANYVGRLFKLKRAHHEAGKTFEAGQVGVSKDVDIKSLSVLLEMARGDEHPTRAWIAEDNLLLHTFTSTSDTETPRPTPKPAPTAPKYKRLQEYTPKMTVVKSSNIKALGHEDGGLLVEFTNGTGYIYPGVPKDTMTEILAAESMGKAFNTMVKNNDDYKAVKLEA